MNLETIEQIIHNHLELLWTAKDNREFDIYLPVFSKCLGLLSQNGYRDKVLDYLQEYIMASRYMSEELEIQ